MNTLLRCSACAHQIEQEMLNQGAEHLCPVCGEQLVGQDRRNNRDEPNVIAPSDTKTPSLESFEELGIPEPFRAVVEKELTANETMLWLGRPSRNARVHPSKTVFLLVSIGMILLALGIVAASVISHAGAKRAAGGPDVFPLVFAGALGVIGLVFLIPWLTDPTKFCKACYIVTNRRVLLLELSPAQRTPCVKSYLPHQLLGLERKDNTAVAGAGDLIFEYIFALPGNSFDPNTRTWLPQGGAGFGRSDAPKRIPRGFFCLDHVRDVEQLIRTTLLEPLEQTLDQGEPDVGGSAAPTAATQTGTAVASAPASSREYREDGLIPSALKEKALAEIDPKEKLVWMGQPDSKLILVRSAGYLVAGVLLTPIALLLLFGALTPLTGREVLAPQQPGKKAAGAKQNQSPKVAAAKQESSHGFLIPAGILLGSACLAAVPFVRRYAGRRTCYALTNRRALVYKEGFFGATRASYPPLEVSNMRRSDSWFCKGSGDLIFRTVKVISAARLKPGLLNQGVKTTHFGFLAIPHVHEVEKLVRETLIDRFVDKLNHASAL